ncbi:hypothetical protein [Microbulbifer sp. ALW1]|uniref:hypothetical protein n=1 Tax=Microbulbifer sp. (strain ALW1) TaxID=1516059 RepID=UPI0013570763|nr:hypothetical protein [Microbulbifer sp. ALW1]
MSENEWIDAFSVPMKSKLALFLLSFFAIIGFGFVGYKMGSYTLIAICSLLCIFLWGFAFYRTWIFVDKNSKSIILRKRFYLTWNKSIPYSGMRLRVGGGAASSPSFQQHGQTGSHDIYLTEPNSERGVIIFSSSVGKDFRRVRSHLKKHFDLSY